METLAQMWILVLLGKQVATRTFEKQPTAGILIGGVKYIRATSGKGAVGHYDWLRSPEGRIVGYRFWHFDDGEERAIIQELVDFLDRKSYSQIASDRTCFSVFFSTEKTYLEAASNDQELGDSGIYRSDTGFAMYLDASGLNDSEIASLHLPVA